MKKLYEAPEAEVHFLGLETTILQTSSGFNGNVDDAIEDVWDDVLSSYAFMDIL